MVFQLSKSLLTIKKVYYLFFKYFLFFESELRETIGIGGTIFGVESLKSFDARVVAEPERVGFSPEDCLNGRETGKTQCHGTRRKGIEEFFSFFWDRLGNSPRGSPG